MKNSDHGIRRDEQEQEQPADKKRAQAVHRTDPKRSASHEATRDPKLSDAEKPSRSGKAPDDRGDLSSG